MRVLPVLLAAAAGLGTAAGIAWPSLAAPSAWTAAVAVVIGVEGLRRRRRPVVTTAVVALVLAVAGLRGAAAIEQAGRSPVLEALAEAGVADDAREAVVLEGRLLADAAPTERAILLRLDVDRVRAGRCACIQPVRDVVLVSIGGLPEPSAVDTWRAGRRVRVTGAVRRARGFWNLGAAAPARDHLGRGYGVIATTKSALLVEVRARGPWPLEALAALRAHARRAIAAAAGDDAVAAAIGTAVLIGDRAGLDPDLVARLQRAGTFHVVAISGGNIALLVLGVTAVVRRLVRRRGAVALLAAAAIAVYAVLVGGGASVLRATGMALVALGVMAVDIRAAGINVLAATSVLLVLAWPALAVDAGFLRTTAATVGILLGARIERTPRWWVDVAVAAVSASLAAEAAILPIQTTVFQQVTLAGPLLNLAAIPGMALVQFAAMAAVALSAVSAPAAALAGVAMRVGAHIVVETAALVDAWPWLTWRVSPPAVLGMLAYYLSVASVVWSIRAPSSLAARVRTPALGAAAMAFTWVSIAPLDFVRHGDGHLALTAFDVGQGDGLLVTFPDGSHLLVDAGGGRPGGFDIGARVVGPTLRARGIRRLEYVAVTHADADHIGGAASLVREFRPREVWTGIPVDGDVATAAVKAAATDVGAAWRPLRRGQQVEIGGTEVAVLHPPEPEWDRQRVRNDDSVVLQVGWRGLRFVLTGDIGADVERLLAGAGGGRWPFTVLKVAHHGSAGSSDGSFLAALHPGLAVVSVGEGNPFGHPAPPVLQRLDQIGASVWRTDLLGEITIRSDGRQLDVVSHTGRRAVLAIPGGGWR